MNLLDDKKKEIIKHSDFIFEPINGRVVSFEKTYDIYSGIHQSGSTESIFSEKNKTTFFPIIISTTLGELRISIESDYLNDLKLAIGVAYAYSSFHEKNKIPEDVSLEIQRRIYSLPLKVE